MLKVKIVFKGAHVVQPADEIRKLDDKAVIYKKIIGDKIEVSPIPPISLRGALRHMACIAARNLGNDFRKAYFNLFGSDVTKRCFGEEREKNGEELTPSTKEGKISIILLKGISLNNLSENKSKIGGNMLKNKFEIRPRIKIDVRKGVIEKRALAFSKTISDELDIIFGIKIHGELDEKEEKLLRTALLLLRGWGIGGWTSIGFGIVKNVEILEGDSDE